MHAYHVAAQAAGATDNGLPGCRAAGLPGMRESCHPNCCGAFVIKPWS